MFFCLVFLFVCLFFLATVSSMWDLSSLTRDQTRTPALEVQSLNHWIAREVPLTIYGYLETLRCLVTITPFMVSQQVHSLQWRYNWEVKILQWFSKCGLQTSSIASPGDLLAENNGWSGNHWPTGSETVGRGPSNMCMTTLPRGSDTH